MVRAESEKKARIEMIEKEIYNNAREGMDTVEEKLIYKYCDMWGTTRRTMLEYIKEMTMVGKIKRDFGLLFPIKAVDVLKGIKEAEKEAEEILK